MMMDEIMESRCQDYQNEIKALKDQESIMRAKWEEEKNLNDNINNKKEELENAKFKLEIGQLE